MTQAPQKAPYTTNNVGIPVESDEHSLTVGPDGPILLQDHYLIEKMAQFNRERVPERVVHAKGSGAYGFFEVTNDVSQFTKADLFQPGKRTDMLARFSTVAGEQGSPDTWRDPRGFALKFYTEHGNYDLVGNNTPVFFVRDTIKFQDFIRSQKRHPATGLRSNDMQWDFWTLSPESAHQVTWLMGDRGIPKTYRHMNGYSSHTYMWINGAGERFWVKYHFKTDQGIEFLTQAEADELAGQDGGQAPPGPVRVDRVRERADLDPEGPDHAVRGRGGLPLQPLRPDQGLAARRLPADRRRPDDPQQEPGGLLHPHRAGRLRAVEPGAGHRPLAGQDAARPAVLVPGHPPVPDRPELHPAAAQPAALPGELVRQGRPDALRAVERGAAVRAQLLRRPRGRLRTLRRPRELADRRRAGARGVQAAPRGRRLGPGGHDGPPGPRRRGPRPAGVQRQRPSEGRRVAPGPRPRPPVLAQHRQGDRRPDRRTTSTEAEYRREEGARWITGRPLSAPH